MLLPLFGRLKFEELFAKFNNVYQTGLYGRSLNIWDWQKHERIQTIDLGNEGLIPLEIRFLHDPEALEGYVGAALSSNIFRYFRKQVRLK